MSQSVAAGAMSSQQTSHPFTCNTCQVAFRSGDMQRAHMQTDWHRYNLKRRVASLPPLSSEIFAEKVLASKASAAATAAKASYEKACPACQKTYYSENAFNNHLNSQKHRMNTLRMQKRVPSVADDDSTSMMSSAFSLMDTADTVSNGLPSEAEEEFSAVVKAMQDTAVEHRQDKQTVSQRPSRPHHSSAEENRPFHPLSRITTAASDKQAPREKKLVTDCLFCNYNSPTFRTNIDHMRMHHGMFIPEQEYLVDEEGLVNYLHEKIFEVHECLWCGKQKTTASGIQTHMRDLGHCMIAFGTEEEQLEIGEFYDFRSTYSDADEWESESEEDGPAPGGVKLGAVRSSTIEVEGDGAKDGNAGDDGWETDSTLSSVPTDEIGSIPIEDRSHRYAQLPNHRHHSHADPRKHHEADGWHSHAHHTPHAVYHDEYELHLPTGRVAGHRSLKVYYRQNLRNYPTPEERAERRAIMDGDGGRHASDSEDEGAASPERGRGRDQQRQIVSRANGGLGMVGVSEAGKRIAQKDEVRARKEEERARRKQEWGNEKRANFQKHYRDPLLQ